MPHNKIYFLHATMIHSGENVPFNTVRSGHLCCSGAGGEIGRREDKEEGSCQENGRS